MDKTQTGSQIEIFLRFNRIAKVFMRLPQTQVQRWIKIFHSLVIDYVCVLQRELIPTQGFCGTFLETGQIMGGNAGVVIIPARFPSLLIARAGSFESMFEFSARACEAELDDWIVGIHAFVMALPNVIASERTPASEAIPD
jgi:hypothetical protein